jgi:aquaporin Z
MSRSVSTRPEHRIPWAEAAMEALGLFLFMVSAGVFGTLLESPSAPLHQAIPNPFARRALMGLAMGLTAVGLVYSPWGRRSGAHINPAFTTTMFRLGRVKGPVAAAYIVAQFLGGLCGVYLVAAVFGSAFLDPPVAGVATLPGPAGVAVAFLAELGISFALVSMVLALGRQARLAPYTGFFVGALVCLYITFEAPLSGMSMNPARTVASALPTATWRSAWIYFAAPLAGMLLAAEAHLRRLQAARAHQIGCAKLSHSLPCIFCQRSPSGP